MFFPEKVKGRVLNTTSHTRRDVIHDSDAPLGNTVTA